MAKATEETPEVLPTDNSSVIPAAPSVPSTDGLVSIPAAQLNSILDRMAKLEAQVVTAEDKANHAVSQLNSVKFETRQVQLAAKEPRTFDAGNGTMRTDH